MVKEVAGHLCDTERILTYRALRFSRGDKTNLPPFEENDFVTNSNYKNRTLANITEEFIAIRKSSIAMFENFSEEMFERRGIANNNNVSVRALLFFTISHTKHHLGVINERYLSPAYQLTNQ
jgi:hypothetical protein